MSKMLSTTQGFFSLTYPRLVHVEAVQVDRQSGSASFCQSVLGVTNELANDVLLVTHPWRQVVHQ